MRFFSLEFPQLPVEWFAFWKFNNSQNSWYFFVEISLVTFAPILNILEFLVETRKGHFLFLYRSFPHSTSVRTNNYSTRARLGWKFSYIYCIFFHPTLDSVPLFAGMRERSIVAAEQSVSVDLSMIHKKLNTIVSCLYLLLPFFFLTPSLEGVSRSATVVLAHVMNSNQMSLDEATDFIKSVYPKAK